MKKILIGEISSYKAIVIAKYLKKYYSDVAICAYDYNKRITSVHTRYCDEFVLVPSPKIDPQSHLRHLRQLIEDKTINLFIPVPSDMYGEYIKNKKMFGEAFAYIGNYDQFERLHDKEKLEKLLAELNIKRPRTFDSYDSAEPPFVIKPTNLSSARGVKYVFNEKDRNAHKAHYNSEQIIQEYVKGVGVGYSVFARNGKILNGYGHVRLAEQPITGGSSVYRDSYYDTRMREMAAQIVRATKWSGFAMLEFKLTDEDEIYVIEVNPRIWGSINQGLQNGCNYFAPLLGTSSLTINETVQWKTYLSPLIYLSLINYLAKRDLRPLKTFLRNIRRNRADVSCLDDPRGFASLIIRKMSPGIHA
ncbi:MAG: ATP-grasp domain-containing protein [Syntrophales bacterium]|jgi:predicted ATP-grasp superfamily ATP-dependent carboligase|nr:ATP-grasp domain-containing protein [Syntrophales bacterium]MCK9528852.1 ATP-grasp domain-containing protein [Syntrophales bacterium]MDX9921054.1 ATP-grasp domain-containing protein [Syntrophales bacterium]